MTTKELIQGLEQAIDVLDKGMMRKVEGEAFTMYRVGDKMIRIDIDRSKLT